jgi:hypothetical protein
LQGAEVESSTFVSETNMPWFIFPHFAGVDWVKFGKICPFGSNVMGSWRIMFHVKQAAIGRVNHGMSQNQESCG